MLKNEEDVIKLIQSDDNMMKIIHTAGTLDLPDWWICAGFVRSKIWDTLHGFEERTLTPDVDVIYFDPANINEDDEKKLEDELKSLMPVIPWSVKNQVRMHVVNQIPPYTSSEDAISKFPETATALGVKLDKENKLVLTALWTRRCPPYGIKADAFFYRNERACCHLRRAADQEELDS